MPDKKRVTLHNQRTNRRTGKAFTTFHNDRNFPEGSAEHIDPARLEQNLYWSLGEPSPYHPKRGEKRKTFEQVEDEFYKKMFSRYLEKKNERRRASRHKQQTMKQYRRNKRFCPEETLFYLGKKGDSVDADTLAAVLKDYLDWQKENYPQVHVLDWALHCDEEGAPHVHIRQVYVAYDENGMPFVGQEKCLEQMGVEKSKGKLTKDRDGNLVEKDRYNNRKTTFTKTCREKLQELALARGLEIETTPRAPRESGRDLNEWRAAQDRATADKKLAEVRAAKELIDEARSLKDLVAANTQIMLAVDAALKGLTFKPLAQHEARKAATETLAILAPLQRSADLYFERLSGVGDIADMREKMNTRIRRARDACKRALDNTRQRAQRAEEESAARRKEADDYRQRRLQEAQQALDDAAKKAADLDAREKALDTVVDQKAKERARGYIDKLRDDVRDLQSKITVHRDSVTALQGEITTLEEQKTALETEIKRAKQQITPLMKTLTSQSVDDVLRAAAVIEQARNTHAHDHAHDSGVSVEDTVMRALDAQAQQRRGRSSSPSYDR